MLWWSYTSRAKRVSFVLRSVYGKKKTRNKRGDVKFNTLLGSFALFSANLHTVTGSPN